MQVAQGASGAPSWSPMGLGVGEGRACGRLGVAGRGVGWEGVRQPHPHCTLSSSYCIEKYFYICNVCCKTRKKKRRLSTKKKTCKGKNVPMLVCAGFYSGISGRACIFSYVWFRGGAGVTGGSPLRTGGDPR